MKVEQNAKAVRCLQKMEFFRSEEELHQKNLVRTIIEKLLGGSPRTVIASTYRTIRMDSRIQEMLIFEDPHFS